MSYFDLKNWNTGGTKIWSKFSGQNDSIISLRAPREKMSHFDLKNWNTGGTKIWPKKIETLVELKFDLIKIETLAELKFNPNF